jgi:phage baseplate assembly protein W
MTETFFDFPPHRWPGRTAGRSPDHLRDLIHQVLFTVPGERVNRPDFGCGIAQLTFTQFRTSGRRHPVPYQGALTRWLDSVISMRSASWHWTIR